MDRVPKRFTRKWVGEHPEQWKELSKPPDECPICLQKMRTPRSPLLGDYPTTCRHFCCRNCWLEIWAMGPPWRCPTCRENVTHWLAREFNTTVRIERVDRDMLRAYVLSTLQRAGHPVEDFVFEMGRSLLRQVDSSDDET